MRIEVDDSGHLDLDNCDIPVHPSDYFCRWSALHRPGAWEWATAWGEAMRRKLAGAGWRCTIDPCVSYRVIWLKLPPRVADEYVEAARTECPGTPDADAGAWLSDEESAAMYEDAGLDSSGREL